MTTRPPTMERSSGGSPVDNATYNLLQTLTSKLEAIEAYGKYKDDADDEARRFFESCLTSDRQAADQALQLLKTKLGNR
jgi:hypothetical protein